MTLEELQKLLNESLTEMKSLIDAQKAEIAQNGEMSTKTSDAIATVGEQLSKLQTEMAETKSAVDAATAAANRHGVGQQMEVKTAGQLFVTSDEFLSISESKGVVTSSIDVGSFHKKSGILSSDPASGGALVEPFRDDTVVVPAERAMRLRDVMNVRSLTSNAVEYAQETGFANLCTTLTAAATGGDTEITVAYTGGIIAGESIFIDGEEITVVSVDDDTTLTVSALAGGHSLGADVTANVFACTPETKLKPQAKITYSLETVGVCTIAHWIPVSRQIISDAAQVQGLVDSRLRYGLKLAEEHQILYGDGSGNLQGILTHPDIGSYSWSSGLTTDTKLDAIRRGMVIARLAEYPVTGVVMHPLDVADVELSKGSDGHYISMSVNDSGEMSVWRVPVIETTAIKQGTALAGAFGLGAILWDREQDTVRIAEQHEDFFVKNMVALLAEERVAQTIYRPEAFVEIDFDAQPS